MAWNDRVREAAYTSPSGTRITFGYEDVRKTVEKKTTGFEFPDANGTYVQDLGHSGRRYPMRVFFWGNDYDQDSDSFESLLLEQGVGKLEHPIYGAIDVVPFGTVTRRDDLKTAANQAVIDLTFWETIGLIYPDAKDDSGNSVLLAVDAYNDAASQNFGDVVDLDTAIERVSLKNSYQSLLGNASDGLQDIANEQDDVRRQFNAIVDSVNQGIDILVEDPITLASQTTQLIQSPARSLADIVSRLDEYGSLLSSITSSNNPIFVPGNDSRNSNEFHTNDIYASTYVTGSIVSVVNNQFFTKTEAISAAETILNQLDSLVVWREANYASLDQIDTGESYQKLQEAVAITAGFLVEISFSLKQERRIVLDRDRTIIDLTAELYGSIDDQLDFFISSNGLSGSEILELPQGREILYYV